MMKVTRVAFWSIAVAATLVYVNFEYGQSGATEAPAAFDNKTKGFISQRQYDVNREIFDEQESIDEGLGPVYNATSCGECHQNPISGGISQTTELRAAVSDGRNYEDHPGGSLINDRAIDSSIQEYVL